MEKTICKLNPECYLIAGKKGFLIMNLYAGSIIPVNDKVGTLLSQAELNEEVDKSTPELEELVKMGWAQFYEKPTYVEKIRVTNHYGKKHLWKAAPVIDTATIQLTNDCSLQCEDCFSTQRCPSCKRYENANVLGKEEWYRVLDALALYETKSLIITGGDPVLHGDFDAILTYAKTKIPSVFVHVPSMESVEKVRGKAGIFFTVLKQEDVKKMPIFMKHKTDNIKVFIPEKYRKFCALPQREITYVNADNVNIGRENMYSTGMDAYRLSLKMMYNECFFGKICVNSQGEIIPCLGCNEPPLGSLLDKNYHDTMRYLIENYWYKNIDASKSDIKCGECEYRYVCRNICHYSGNENSCTYDVEAGKWM